MPARPLAAVPNIFAAEGTGSPNNIPLLDADFATLVSQTNDSSIGYVNYAVDTGTANAYVVLLASPPSGYVSGMTVAMLPLNNNTGASTINVSSLGVVNILSARGASLVGGEITASQVISMIFDGTGFRIQDSFAVVNVLAGTVTVSQTVNCAGASSVTVSMTTSTSGLNIILQNVGMSVPIFLYVTNPSGAPISFGITGTSFSGSALTVQGFSTSTGTAVSLSTTGVSIPAGLTYVFWGSSFAGGSVIFMYV